MFNLCLRTIILLWVLVFLGTSLEAQTNENEENTESAQKILIFRTSPGKESRAEGWFRFQVSAFSPLLVVKVNGFAQMISKDADWAEYEIPYFLKQGKNLFTIFVQTKTGEREEEFIVSYEPPAKKSKAPPPLNGVIMFGQTNSDNMLSVQEANTKTSAAKNDLLLSGAYAFEINDESAVSLNAVLKFDRHQNRSLVAEEVLFRQFGTEYRHKNLLSLDFSSGLGQSVISLKEANPTNPYKAGEFSEDVQSLFLFISAKKSWGRQFSGSLKIQLDSQNKVTTDSEDGNLTLISLGAKSRWDEFRFQGRLDSKSTALKDSSKDYQTTVLDAGVSYSWTPWVFGLNYQNMNQQYANADPATNVVLQNKKDEMSLNCKYSFSNSTIVGGDLKQIKQSSNDATKAYQANQFTMQYIWMF
ncbi:MAG: porin [Deltaproteobacteria bacterium]|nr:porin [Deltaproteobacteria bacterium]